MHPALLVSFGSGFTSSHSKNNCCSTCNSITTSVYAFLRCLSISFFCYNTFSLINLKTLSCR